MKATPIPAPSSRHGPAEDPQTRTLDQVFDHFRAHPVTVDVDNAPTRPDVMTFFQVADAPDFRLSLLPAPERWLCAECLADLVFDRSVTVRAAFQTAEPFFCHGCRDATAEAAATHEELRRLPR